ncbi:formate/nitrite transporter family protein [Halocatena pleomorpha]|uniref:Formate/nitrite transporter n=1 Tax=Halocatena pleomorpha TaxID=1785090 RepID=A0A3P3RD92_9EURY|nr:formate/nitrite transporter [Halocatena pleomorpha]
MSRSRVSTLTSPIHARDHTKGPDDAPVTLVEYGDYDCPSCSDLYPILRRIQDRLGNRLRFAFRHFPLSSVHPNAQHAAEAAEAAGSQGQFWQMHDQLYEHQDALEEDHLIEYAAELGLDTDQFKQELHERVHEQRVNQDVQSGTRSGVTGTPTFFINGERYEGPLEFEHLLRALAEAGGFLGIQSQLDSDTPALRETIDRSRRGAPAAGAAIRDRFSSDEIFQRIVASADEEIDSSTRELFFSGLAAGFAITLTFLGHAVGSALFPTNSFLSAVLYPLGFLYIIMGRYQLYTENTLPPVALVLTRLTSVPMLFRVWLIVLAGNAIGAGLGAFTLANSHVLSPAAMRAGAEFTRYGISLGWWDVFLKALFTGWLVAGVVWLDHAARDTVSRFLLIYIVFYMIAGAELYHVITAACEAFYFVLVSGAGLFTVLYEFWLPVLLGNTIGGVVLVALVNYAQTTERRFPDRDRQLLKLSWSDWLFGQRTTRPEVSSFVEDDDADSDD